MLPGTVCVPRPTLRMGISFKIRMEPSGDCWKLVSLHLEKTEKRNRRDNFVYPQQMLRLEQ